MSGTPEAEQGAELWRGGVSAWECDQFGHLNVRFYLARAAEGLASLAIALGMPDAFRREATATVRPLGWHVRYLREARAGASLRLSGGITGLGEDWAEAVMVMRHAVSGEPAASFRTRFEHVTTEAADRRFAWPARVITAADRLRAEAPGFSAARGLDEVGYLAEESPPPEGARPALRGVFGPAECDVFGRVRSDAVIARDVDGGMSMGSSLAEASARADPDYRPAGRAVLEYRLRHFAWPRAGDALVGFNGVSRVDERAFRTTHRMLDPATGRLWSASETLVGAFDLAARKLAPLQDVERRVLGERLIDGVVL